MASKKKHLTFKEAYIEKGKDSLCSVLVSEDLIHIRFKGSVAAIPSLKNQKIQGTNILRGEAKASLSLMTNLFNKATNYSPPAWGGEVFMLVLCAYRKNTFDEDNVMTTVKDWLEPQIIRRKDRGWGVGVVKNDRNIIGYARKKTKQSRTADVTDIILRPMSFMKIIEEQFLAHACGVEEIIVASDILGSI